CFGCHEIAGMKSGRPVGPDLRLEPVPALDWLTPLEQEKARSDPANPPGTYLKVGPALRRLKEKTNEVWTRKWLLNPRGFRDDTRMPHFYGLSTNSAEALAGTGQEKFPDAEIHSITHYLFAESQAFLRADETARKALLAQLKEMQSKLKEGPLTEKERKELIEASRRFADLALMSRPDRAAEINKAYADLKQTHDKLFELLATESTLPDRVARLEKR